MKETEIIPAGQGDLRVRFGDKLDALELVLVKHARQSLYSLQYHRPPLYSETQRRYIAPRDVRRFCGLTTRRDALNDARFLADRFEGYDSQRFPRFRREALRDVATVGTVLSCARATWVGNFGDGGESPRYATDGHTFLDLDRVALPAKVRTELLGRRQDRPVPRWEDFLRQEEYELHSKDNIATARPCRVLGYSDPGIGQAHIVQDDSGVLAFANAGKLRVVLGVVGACEIRMRLRERELAEGTLTANQGALFYFYQGEALLAILCGMVPSLEMPDACRHYSQACVNASPASPERKAAA